MGTLIIPDLDDHVIECLEAQASENQRSLEEEIRRLLTERAGRSRPPERPAGWLGSMSDRTRITGDITTPTSELVPWDVEQD